MTETLRDVLERWLQKRIRETEPALEANLAAKTPEEKKDCFAWLIGCLIEKDRIQRHLNS